MSSFHRLTVGFVLSVAIILPTLSWAAAPPSYRIEVAEFHQGADYGLVTGFNNSAHAVFIQHSFGTRSYWWNGTESVQLPAARSSSQPVVLDVSDDDVAVGLDIRGGTQRMAAIWNQGVPQSLGTLGGNESSAEAINDLGVVTGWSQVASGAKHLFTWNGNFTDHGPLPPSATCCHDIPAINNAGQVIGHDSGSLLLGWLYDAGQFMPLPDIAGGNHSSPNDINNSGLVVGSSWVNQRDRLPATWQNAQIELLPMPAGSVGGEAAAVNDLNQIAGYVAIQLPNLEYSPQAMLWANDDAWQLRHIVNNLGDWHLRQAEAINERGQILVFAYSESHAWRRVILTPVPEPTATVSIVVGACSLMLRRRRGELKDGHSYFDKSFCPFFSP